MDSALTFRAGRATDAPELAELVTTRLPDTRFKGLTEVHPDVARKLFAQAAFRHGHTKDGATWLQVAESERGIEAFILAGLSRIYLVGTKLCAQDMFLLGRKDCSPLALDHLIAGYVDWASGCPDVVDIHLSWSDALDTGSRFGSVFQRKGFVLCGENYRLTRATENRRAA